MWHSFISRGLLCAFPPLPSVKVSQREEISKEEETMAKKAITKCQVLFQLTPS